MEIHSIGLSIWRESFWLVEKLQTINYQASVSQHSIVYILNAHYVPSLRTIRNIVSKKPGTLSEPWVSICTEKSYQCRFNHIDQLTSATAHNPLKPFITQK